MMIKIAMATESINRSIDRSVPIHQSEAGHYFLQTIQKEVYNGNTNVSGSWGSAVVEQTRMEGVESNSLPHAVTVVIVVVVAVFVEVIVVVFVEVIVVVVEVIVVIIIIKLLLLLLLSLWLLLWLLLLWLLLVMALHKWTTYRAPLTSSFKWFQDNKSLTTPSSESCLEEVMITILWPSNSSSSSFRQFSSRKWFKDGSVLW